MVQGRVSQERRCDRQLLRLPHEQRQRSNQCVGQSDRPGEQRDVPRRVRDRNGSYTIGSPYWRTDVGSHENSGSRTARSTRVVTFGSGVKLCSSMSVHTVRLAVYGAGRSSTPQRSARDNSECLHPLPDEGGLLPRFPRRPGSRARHAPAPGSRWLGGDTAAVEQSTAESGRARHN